MPGYSTNSVNFDEEKLDKAFGWRTVPDHVLRITTSHPFLTSDEKDAEWFRSRSWRDLSWDNWNERFRGIFFFTNEALAYYMPSIIKLSQEERDEQMLAIDSLLMQLASEGAYLSKDVETSNQRLLLTKEECKVLLEWLRYLTLLPYYETGVGRVRIETIAQNLQNAD